MITIVISTFNRSPNPNYLFETLENLKRSGVLKHPQLHSLHLVDSGSAKAWPTANIILTHSKVWSHRPTERRSAKWNCAAALRHGAVSGADWIVHLEDDLDVCGDFVGSLSRWLDAHGKDDRPNIFSGDYPQFAQKGNVEWQYPVEKFWGMQCFAVRPAVALDIAEWLETHGLPEHNAHDIELHRWAGARGLTWFQASAPSFVQHIGHITSIADNPNGGALITFPSFPGHEWSFVEPKKRLLWVGDAGCPSGFAKATHNILDTLKETYDVTVLGINYRGDPHEFPYPIFAAAVAGDGFGVGRLVWMCDYAKPHVVVLQNDGWNIPLYVQQMRQFKEFDGVPIVAVVAVDGKNFQSNWLDGVAHVIFWTEFALKEARGSGYEGPASIIPLGVDRSVYKPHSRNHARSARGLADERFRDAFIVGNVNRNQPRKRWDLTLKYFADWVSAFDAPNAMLFLHTAPTGDLGINVQQLAAYYGITERLILVQPPTWYGVEEEIMAQTYQCFDVLLSTTQGEGFGLTALEAMACKIPCILPDWSALGDWAREGSWIVPCTETAIGPPYVNVIGGVMDYEGVVNALDRLYREPSIREDYSKRALATAYQHRYDWKNIGARYLDVLREVVDAK